MKVLLVNGSPHEKGCTYTGLFEVAKELEKSGVETEIVHIGKKPIGGCIGCGGCSGKGKCVFGADGVNSIIEKAEESFDLEEAQKLEQKLRKQNFDLEDYLAQLRQMKKMGSFSSILKMIPGLGSKLKDIEIDDKEFVKIEAIICSMTKEERRNPKVLNGSRRLRIAKGSGTTVEQINKFMKSFEMTQKMMKEMTSNKGMMKRMMKNMNMNMDDLNNLKF